MNKGGKKKKGGGGGGGEKEKGGGNPQMVIVLCGLPGCGKSTFSQDLEQNENWVRINQDDLGRYDPFCSYCTSTNQSLISAAECKNQLEKALKKKKSAVIDRCNASQGDRRMWITEARRCARCTFQIFSGF